ncbi:MAG: hypothetical protein DA330_01755 [Nitrososphaera sp.]|nr:hypothetical protein [Nitrososphaera sp.]
MLGKKVFIFLIALTLAFSIVSTVDPYFLNNQAFAEKDDEEDEKDDNNSGRDDDDEEDDKEKSSEDDEDDDDSSDNDDEKDDEDENNGRDEERDDGEDDDDSNSGRDDEDDNGRDDEDEKDDDKNSKDDDSKHGLVQDLGNNSKVALSLKGETELEVEIEDSDLPDATYDVQFACTNPDVEKTFDDGITVADGHGESEFELGLAPGEYLDCTVKVDELSAAFPKFMVMQQESDDDEEEDERDDDHEEEQDSETELEVKGDRVEIEAELKGLTLADGSYDAVFSCTNPSVEKTFAEAFRVHDSEGKFNEKFTLEEGTYDGCKITSEEIVIAVGSFEIDSNEVRENAHDRKQEIVTTVNAKEIHERHVKAEPASPGPYQPGQQYTLIAAGDAVDGDITAGAEVEIDAAVWKSNSAIVLIDITGGKVTIDDGTASEYDVVVGYAIFSMKSNTLRINALAVDDAGETHDLRLRGEAEMHEDMAPEMVLDSLHLLFDGNSGKAKNEFGDWELFLDGAIEKSG